MNRNQYIRAQQEAGRKALAVLPIHYPKEILTAMNILAVELWGPPGPPRGPDAGRIQSYVCAVVRNALAFMAAGGADAVDGVLFPHTCDSIQGLATVAPDIGGWHKPVLPVHPRPRRRPAERPPVPPGRAGGPGRRSSKRLTGVALASDALRHAIELHAEIDAVRARLSDRRAHLDTRRSRALHAAAARRVPVARGPPRRAAGGGAGHCSRSPSRPARRCWSPASCPSP